MLKSLFEFFSKLNSKLYTLLKLFYYRICYKERLKIQKISSNLLQKGFSIDVETNDGYVEIGENFVCRSACKIRSRNGYIKIGKNVFLNNGVSINSLKEIVIGDDCIIGENVLFYDHDHKYEADKLFREQEFKMDKISIGKNVWIGSNVTILRGTTVGNNAVIGAGVILKGNIPDDTIIYSKNEYIVRKIN